MSDFSLCMLLVGGFIALPSASEELMGGEVCRRVGGEEGVEKDKLGEEVYGTEVGGVMGTVLCGVGAGSVTDKPVQLRVSVVLTAGCLLKKATCGLSRILRTAPKCWMGSAVV